MSASETPIALVRRPNGLVTLSLREKCALEFETDKPAELTVLTEQDGPYEVVMTPLTWQAKRLTETQGQLLTAWESLHTIQSLNSTVSASLRTVLQHTVPELSQDTVLPPLPWEQTTKPVRVAPTAAHPRAFQGTKYKPPKAKAPDAVDLRPYLCDAEGQTRLLSSLNRENGEQDSTQGDTDREAALPQPFRLFLWPSLRHKAETERERFLALYWELSLDRSPHLLAAIALLVNRQPTTNTCKWCDIIAQQPEEWRLTFAALLFASDAYQVKASTLAPSALPLFWEVQNGPCPVYRLFWLFRALVIGLDCDYMAAGLHLADQVQTDYPFLCVTKSGYFPEPAAKTLLNHLEFCERYYPRLAMEIWKHCGELHGLGQILEEIVWTYYTPDLAYSYLHLFMNRVYDDLSNKWNWMRSHNSQIDTLLRSLPTDFQAKCIAHISDLLWFFETSEEMHHHMSAALTLLQRLCRPPYKRICDTTYVTSDFLAFLPSDAVQRFLAAPETSFLRLEEACRLENNARLIGYGTWVLTPHLPEFVIECFRHYPTKLFKVAKRLGGLPEELREQVVRDFGQSPLMENGLLTQDLADAAEIIQRHRPDGIFNPMPKKLQEHLAGLRTLSKPQIAMYREQMNRQLWLMRLETLERATLSALQGHFDSDPSEPNVGHALTMVHSAEENRRALKKFLAAHWGGDDDYRLRHPLTQAWLQKHLQINVATWQKGIIFRAESAAHGTLTLSVEQDPLEALKLGTYVGSCLGLGGSFTYSAVAAVLDINKQVVYARNTRGSVVARQLLAISEDNQLVCYSVYPGSTVPAVQKIFIDYDRKFAEVLNISLFSADADAEYEIDTILSHDWWDDWVWDFSIDGADQRKPIVSGKIT